MTTEFEQGSGPDAGRAASEDNQPGAERERRIGRALRFLRLWDQGDTLVTYEGRTLRYTDLAALVEDYTALGGGRADQHGQDPDAHGRQA